MSEAAFVRGLVDFVTFTRIESSIGDMIRGTICGVAGLGICPMAEGIEIVNIRTAKEIGQAVIFDTIEPSYIAANYCL